MPCTSSVLVLSAAERLNVGRTDSMTQRDLISEVMALEPPVYLFGGFAEDAVLYGKVSRPHQDVDVLIWLDQLAMRIEQVRVFGFHSFEVRFEAAPGHPCGRCAVKRLGSRILHRRARFPGARLFLSAVEYRAPAVLVAA